ncbi:C-factor [Trametes punicea]|nr:C-factor [Trametes punicea]
MGETYTWLITGTSRGIGFELTKQLLADPANIVIATCRNPAQASGLRALEPLAKDRLHIVALDVASETSIHESFKIVERLLDDKGLDYLYNNAGHSQNEGSDTAFTFNSAVALRTFRTNIIGPALVAQAYLPLLEKGKRKVVVNMSSSLGSISLGTVGPAYASYSISKTSLNMLTYKQKAERPDMTFISMDPGWVKTAMGGEGATLEPEASVYHILKIVTKLTTKDSGKFFRYSGEELPW